MKTHLIVLTSLDELRAKKEALVQKFSDDGNLKKYGDDSVETGDEQIFFLKVITLGEYRTKLMQEIGRGYGNIDLSSVLSELGALVATIYPIQNPSIKEPSVEPSVTGPDKPTEEEEEEEEEEEVIDDEEVDIRNN